MRQHSMRFTAYQYQKAIQALREAKKQLEPNGQCCACCGDSGHQAFECGHNPLVAMNICEELSAQSREEHEKLHKNEDDEDLNVSADKYHNLVHFLAGFDSWMGEVVGPAKVHLPFKSKY